MFLFLDSGYLKQALIACLKRLNQKYPGVDRRTGDGSDDDNTPVLDAFRQDSPVNNRLSIFLLFVHTAQQSNRSIPRFFVLSLYHSIFNSAPGTCRPRHGKKKDEPTTWKIPYPGHVVVPLPHTPNFFFSFFLVLVSILRLAGEDGGYAILE